MKELGLFYLLEYLQTKLFLYWRNWKMWELVIMISIHFPYCIGIRFGYLDVVPLIFTMPAFLQARSKAIPAENQNQKDLTEVFNYESIPKSLIKVTNLAKLIYF